VVVAQETAESFVALDFSVRLANVLAGIDEPVVEPLVISFAAIVLNVFTNGPFQRSLNEEDHSIEAVGITRKSSQGCRMNSMIGLMMGRKTTPCALICRSSTLLSAENSI